MTQPAEPLVIMWGEPGEAVAIYETAWAHVENRDPAMAVWVRFQEEPSGLIVVAALVVDTVPRTGGVTGRRLASIRLGRVEAAINTPTNSRRIRSLVGPRLQAPDETSVAPMMAAVDLAPVHTAISVSRSPRAKIAIPEGLKRPDTFYQEVADLHSELGALTTRPAKMIAEANAVPVTTVYRWLKEARQRGLLPPAKRTTKEIEP